MKGTGARRERKRQPDVPTDFIVEKVVPLKSLRGRRCESAIPDAAVLLGVQYGGSEIAHPDLLAFAADMMHQRGDGQASNGHNEAKQRHIVLHAMVKVDQTYNVSFHRGYGSVK